MNAAELAVLLSRPAPRHLIELDMSADERQNVRAEQRHQFERGLLLWAKTGHPSACGLMREAIAVIGATQPDPAARQFCWLAEAALDTCGERDAASRELALALGREVKVLAEGRFELPEPLALKLWERVRAAPAAGSDTIAAVQHHYDQPAASAAVPAATVPEAVSIPELEIAFEPIDEPAALAAEVPELADSLPPPVAASIPELDIAFEPIDEPAAPAAEVPELVESLPPPAAALIPELDIAFEPIDEPAALAAEVPELAEPLSPPAAAPIPELDIAFEPIDEPAAPAAEVPELAEFLPPLVATPIPELDLAFEPTDELAVPAAEVPELAEFLPLVEAPAVDSLPAVDIPVLAPVAPEVADLPAEAALSLLEPEPMPVADHAPSSDDFTPASLAEAPAPAALSPLPLPMRAPTRTEPHPDVAIYFALASALQSNWQRIAGGSAMHFGLFHDALLTLVNGLPSIGIAPLSRLAEILLARAEELPVAGPAAWEADEIAAALQTMSSTLMAYPAVDDGHLQALLAHCARLALPDDAEADEPAPAAAPADFAAAPLPEAELVQLAADIGTLADVPPAAPASIALEDIPLLSLAADREESEDNRAADNRAIDRAAFVLMAGAQVKQLAQAHALARQHGIDAAFVDSAAALAVAAGQAGEVALAELAAAYAAALAGCHEAPAALLELSADVIAVLADMAGAVQRGEAVEPAPDLVEVLVELTPAEAGTVPVAAAVEPEPSAPALAAVEGAPEVDLAAWMPRADSTATAAEAAETVAAVEALAWPAPTESLPESVDVLAEPAAVAPSSPAAAPDLPDASIPALTPVPLAVPAVAEIPPEAAEDAILAEAFASVEAAEMADPLGAPAAALWEEDILEPAIEPAAIAEMPVLAEVESAPAGAPDAQPAGDWLSRLGEEGVVGVMPPFEPLAGDESMPAVPAGLADQIAALAAMTSMENRAWSEDGKPVSAEEAPPAAGEQAGAVSRGELMPDSLPELNFDDLPDLGFVPAPAPKAAPKTVAVSDPFDFELPVLGEDKPASHR